MCFNVTNPKIQKAAKDITCFKILSGKPLISDRFSVTRFNALYARHFKYSVGKIYNNPSLKTLKCRKGWELTDQGFHSYVNPSQVSYSTFDSTDYAKQSQSVAVECIIPKGSLYLKNGLDNEYISSSIKIVGVLTRDRVKQLKENGKRKSKARLAKV